MHAPPRGQRLAVRRALNHEFAMTVSVRRYVTNISRTGALLRTDEVLPVGTRFRLRCTLLLDEPELLEADVEVVRVVGSEPGRTALGVRFCEPSQAARALLERALVTP